MLAAGNAYAQQQAPAGAPDLNAVPDKMPFATPYAITMERAQSLVQAAVDEAHKRGWAMDIAVVDPNGDLVTFARMDGALLASVAISQHKPGRPHATGVRRMRLKTAFKNLVSAIC